MTFALPWCLYNTSDFGMKGAIAVRQPSRIKRLHCLHCPLSEWERDGKEVGKAYHRGGPAGINKRSASVERAIFLIARLRHPVEGVVEELDDDCFSHPDFCNFFTEDNQPVRPDH